MALIFRSLFLIQNYNKTLDELTVKVDLKTSSLHDDSSNSGSTGSKADLSCSIIGKNSLGCVQSPKTCH